MDTIKEISMMFIWLTRAGVGFRVAYSFLKMIGNDEESGSYRKRIKNAIAFYILAESAFQLRDIAMNYFKYGGMGGPML